MRRAWVSLLLLIFSTVLLAQQSERLSDVEQKLYGNHIAVTGDFETMKAVHRYWVQETLRLKAMRRFEFHTTGYQEGVLKVTIPTSLLFAQTDTLLSTQADGALRPFLHLLVGENAVANVVVSCHSDNNGSPAYLQRQTASRARAVQRWFLKQRVSPTGIVSFGVADRSPRTKNQTMEQRAKNRRITLYFVPTKKMLRNAKKGKL